MTELQTNLLIVLKRLIEVVEEDEGIAEHIADAIECTLDDISMDDGFGTERQCDPRGDMRIKEWSIFTEVQV